MATTGSKLVHARTKKEPKQQRNGEKRSQITK
jgi:hypothetical protein